MNEKQFDRMITAAGKLYIKQETKNLYNSFNKKSLSFQIKMWFLFKKALIKDIIYNF